MVSDAQSLAARRREYAAAPLDATDLDPDPIRQLERWLDHAVHAEVPEPTAMAVATCGAGGQPSVRTVLLKGLDAGGLVFYTNYESRKATDLAQTPRAGLLFYWPELHRQVAVDGTVARVSAEESDRYFATRPRGSQLGAWASDQSRVLESRERLEQRFAAAAAEFADRAVPRPSHWGGYRVTPLTFEFWQGRPNRLHDRFRYARRDDGWQIERLAP